MTIANSQGNRPLIGPGVLRWSAFRGQMTEIGLEEKPCFEAEERV